MIYSQFGSGLLFFGTLCKPEWRIYIVFVASQYACVFEFINVERALHCMAKFCISQVRRCSSITMVWQKILHAFVGNLVLFIMASYLLVGTGERSK